MRNILSIKENLAKSPKFKVFFSRIVKGVRFFSWIVVGLCFFSTHSQNFLDTIWIVQGVWFFSRILGPLGQAIIFSHFLFQQTVAYLLLTLAYAVASTLVFEAHTDNSITPSLHNWTKTQTLIVAVSWDFLKFVYY